MQGSEGSGAPTRLRVEGHELRKLLDNAPLGIHHLDSEGVIFWANRAVLDLLGYAWPEYIGRSVIDLYTDPHAGREALDAIQHGEALRERAAVLGHRDGSIRHVLISSVPWRKAGRFGNTCCFIQDVTEHRLVERRLRAENAVARALVEAASLRQATPKVLEAVCRTTGWSWAAMWVPEAGGEPVLRCVEFWHRPDRPIPEFEAATRSLSFGRGAGLPGAVWATARPGWVADLATNDGMPRREPAAAHGVHAALAFPARGRDGSVLGVMEFFSRHPRDPDPDLLDMMHAIGNQIGQYIERRRGEEALVGSEARNAAIVRASLECIVSMDHRGRVLEWNPAATETFGYVRDEAIGREMAELVIPPRQRDAHRLALSQYLLTGESSVLGRRVELQALHKDGGQIPVELTIVQIPGSQPPVFTGHLRDLSERNRAADTSAKLRSVLQELLVARDIQLSVLPRQVPDLPGIQVASTVRAAAQCSGDFYDYLRTGSGHAVIALGDVSGHGIGPALVAAEAATCLRTLSRTYGRVDYLLTEANAILCEATPIATFLTMILVSIDPHTRSLTYANAGHPSGLIVGPGSRIKQELASMDLPLAVSPDVVFEQREGVTLDPGDLLVLVSDGLIEAWFPDGEAFGRDRLRDAVCSLQPESADTVVERLYDTVRAFTRWAPQHDDMSAVAVKVME